MKHYIPVVGGTYYVTNRARGLGGYARVEAFKQDRTWGRLARCTVLAQVLHRTTEARRPGQEVWTRVKANIWSRRSAKVVAALIERERERLFDRDCA